MEISFIILGVFAAVGSEQRYQRINMMPPSLGSE
jgi:hypothetical protein